MCLRVSACVCVRLCVDVCMCICVCVCINVFFLLDYLLMSAKRTEIMYHLITIYSSLKKGQHLSWKFGERFYVSDRKQTHRDVLIVETGKINYTQSKLQAPPQQIILQQQQQQQDSQEASENNNQDDWSD